MAYLYKDARDGRLAPYAVISHQEIGALQELKRLASVQLYLKLLKEAAGRADGKWLGLKELLRSLKTSKASLYRALADLQGAGLIRRLDNVPNQGTVIELVYPSQCLTGETEGLTGETSSRLTGETIPYTLSTTKTTITPPTPRRGEPKERISKENLREQELQQLVAHLVRNWDASWHCASDRQYARIRHFLDCVGIGIDGDTIKWLGTKRKRAIEQAISAALDIVGDNRNDDTPITGRRVDTEIQAVTHGYEVLRKEYQDSWRNMFQQFGYVHSPDSSEYWRVHTVEQFGKCYPAGDMSNPWNQLSPAEQQSILEHRMDLDIQQHGEQWFLQRKWQ